MQSPKEEPSKYRFSLRDYLQLFRFMMLFQKHQEALEPYLTSLQDKGLSDEQVAALRNVFTAKAQVSQDTGTTYRLDRYLLTGMGAIDVVLIPVLVPMGVSDTALFVALFALAVSLVLVASSLVVGFVKKDLGINRYGSIHGTLIFLSLGSGIVSLAATLWHISHVIAIVFTALAIIAYILCALYAAFARIALAFLQLVQAAKAEISAQATNEYDTIR